MKVVTKSVLALALGVVLLGGIALTSVGAEEFAPAVEIKEFTLEAAYRDGGVQMRWREYLRDDFKWYKVVRSRTNPNPVYPEDQSVHVSDRANQVTFTDRNNQPGIWYYRVTIVTQSNQRWVSPVVRVDISDATSAPPGPRDFR